LKPSAPTQDSPADFSSLGLNETLLQALTSLGYEEPTPIQRDAIPKLLEGRDLLGQAATGTGKTAAFALPLLQRLDIGSSKPFEAGALVLVPTRELAVQVAEAMHSYGKAMKVSVLPIYGGQDIGLQLRRLKHGMDVVVATPGRALDHLRRKTLKLGRVRTVVLDEADEMLDMGFAEDLESILSELPDSRQTALFSATLPPRIAAIAERHLKNPARIRIVEKTPQGTAPRVRQTAYFVSRGQKVAALGRVMDLEAPNSTIVFCRTRTEVSTLTDSLIGLGFKAEALHGGMTQDQRDRVMKRFKAGNTETLVATDVAARGLHVEKLSHVVNFDLPTSPEAYVHRIGRTGRAGQEGVAISFADPRERNLLKNIERITRQRIEIAVVPTASDLRARQRELLQGSLRETLLAGELDAYRVVVESLSEEFDLVEIASAAVKMLLSNEEQTLASEPEVLSPPPPPPRAEKVPRKDKDRERDRERKPSSETFVKIFVGAGRRAGIRPADIVGAIANEAGLKPNRIGSIQITDVFSLVEVPEEEAAKVTAALRQTTLRGRKVKVDRQRS